MRVNITKTLFSHSLGALSNIPCSDIAECTVVYVVNVDLDQNLCIHTRPITQACQKVMFIDLVCLHHVQDLLLLQHKRCTASVYLLPRFQRTYSTQHFYRIKGI